MLVLHLMEFRISKSFENEAPPPPCFFPQNRFLLFSPLEFRRFLSLYSLLVQRTSEAVYYT